jgi:isocitrate dehydrogenase kinase/phosphatase
LIVDKSYFVEEVASAIEPEHIITKVNKYIFELNKNANIKLIVEGSYVEEINIFHKNNSFRVVPNNIYFEGSNNLNINDALVKEELIGFLSMLN